MNWVHFRCLALVLVAACHQKPTQVVAHIEAEAGVRSRAHALRVRVFGLAEGSEPYDERRRLGTEVQLPAHIPILPRGGDDGRRFRLLAELEDADGTVIATVSAEAGFTAGELREFWLRFDDACEGTRCPEDQSCSGGSCGPHCIEPAREPQRPTPAGPCQGSADAGIRDAGSADAAANDAAVPCDCPCEGDTCAPDGTCTPAVAVLQVSLGRRHGCAIATGDALYCWGDNALGAAGAGRDIDVVASPQRISPGRRWNFVVAGHDATMARTDSGETFAWGSDEQRLAGVQGYDPDDAGPFFEPRSQQRQEWNAGVAFFSLGERHGCALPLGTSSLQCWGDNGDGQLGRTQSLSQAWQAAPIATDEDDWRSVDGGDRFGCALSNAGAIHCWGQQQGGRLGNGEGNAGTQRAQPISTSSPFDALSVGRTHSCAIAGDGSLACFGADPNGSGKLGHPEQALVPRRVGEATDWRRVSAGAEHTCGLRGGALFCWGNNDALQLGSDGPSTASPRRVAGGPDAFDEVTTGDSGTCALEGGRLHCFGDAARGRLGLGERPPEERRVRQPTRVCLPPP